MAIERLALLLGRDHLRDWLADALVEMAARTDARVALVVRTDTAGRDPGADGRVDIPETARASDLERRYVALDPVADGPGVRFPAATVDRIAETDAALQNGVGILKGDVLTAPEHGVLSYHHGDIRRYRGVYTHLWNYLDRVATGGVTLLQLTEALDAGAIAAEREVDIADCLTWSELEGRKHRAGVPLVADAIERFDAGREPETVPEDELGRMYYSSDVTLGVVAKYVALETAKTTLNRVRNTRRLLGIWRDSH
ncbi:formyltransferase family protein [Haloglomus halophilum]|uniref:formyltransferase family protein n=1 Tax=Haloglomus halophilum TaxID=2962672 RepID=UPI0020C9637D|nr:formyltransferase family protein [Haloglomus halophilum]